jgi:hypothetical protein
VVSAFGEFWCYDTIERYQVSIWTFGTLLSRTLLYFNWSTGR